MRSHGFEHTIQQGPDLERAVVRHGDVMRATLGRRQAKMGAGLPRLLVTQFAQRARQFRPGNLPRNPHTANVSSRT